MQKITNVKLKETQEFKEKKSAEVKSKKVHLLYVTDWTQLPDCPLTPNSKQSFELWRQEVRNVKLLGLTEEAIEQFKGDLEELRMKMPVPEFENMKNNKEQKETIETLNKRLLLFGKRVLDLEKRFGKLGEIEITEREKAIDALVHIKLESENIVSDKTLLQYPVISEKLEQASQYLSFETENDINSYPLLKINSEMRNISAKEAANEIIKEAKEYFDSLYNLEKRTLQIRKELYNVSDDKIAESLKEYGYRYRF